MSDANESKATKGPILAVHNRWPEYAVRPEDADKPIGAAVDEERDRQYATVLLTANGSFPRYFPHCPSCEEGNALLAMAVRCVNSHAALVAALEQIAAGDTMYDLSKEYRDIARAALAIAKALS